MRIINRLRIVSKSFMYEFLDEIMIEVTLISVLCEILGIDIRQLSG